MEELRNDASNMALSEQMDMIVDKNKLETDLETVIRKVQAMEEERARNTAMRALEEKKLKDLKADKLKLESEVRTQQEVLQQLMQKMNQREETDREIAEMVDEDNLDIDAMQVGEDGAEKYLKLIDYTDSQETVDSLGNKMRKAQERKVTAGSEIDLEAALRRCTRLKDGEHVRVEDMAKGRAAERDNYGNDSDSSNSNASLLKLCALVGINLGCSIDMVEHNLDIIKNMEQSRKDFFQQNIASKNNIHEPSSPGTIDIGDADLKDLCSENEHFDAELEEDYFDHLKNIFSSGKKRKVVHK